MNIINVLVPENTEYISQWKEYNVPDGHCIVDKGVTGCGYTELCLRNELDVILCSPRRILLENKQDKHTKEGRENVLYLRNDMKDLNKELVDYEKRMDDHIYKCQKLGLPVKFMITYDSAPHLINYLINRGLIRKFHIVADEFQSIFNDAYLKSEVENNFVDTLQQCPNVIYLSATPMMDKYLNQLDAFNKLDYYKLDWSKTGYVETLKLQRKHTNSLGSEADKIIESYLKGEFPITLKEGKVVQSKEAVFFFNSVTEITRIIKRNKLTHNQCNIICAEDPNAIQKIEKLGPGFSRGRIPLENEPNKMFTFCTATSYIGADFHSKSASTYVFADPNLRCLALDISLDLPQIAGRQRDRENPFKNNIVIFYKTLRGENIDDREAFDKIQNTRRKKTESSLRNFSNCQNQEDREKYLEDVMDLIEKNHYSKDFVSISKITGLPVYNKLIDIANERAWEVAQKDYQDVINVTRALEDLVNTDNSEYKDVDDKIIDEFMKSFMSTGIFPEKLKMYCEFMDLYQNNKYILISISHKITDPRYKNYYNFFGTIGCKAKRFREDLLKPEFLDNIYADELSKEIINEFNLKDRLNRKEIKEKLKEIYKKLSLSKAAKATDLEEWFEIRPINYMKDGKKENGFEILALKKRQDD